MGKFFRLESPLIQGLGKVTDLIVLNILTILLSVPVITAGAALTSLYDATWRIIQDEGVVYRSYFVSFKTNFKKSTLLWLIILSTGIFLALAAMFYRTKDMDIFAGVAYFALILWAVTSAWVFPMQSRFENPVMITLKNSLICGISHLPRSAVISMLNLTPWFLLLYLTSLWVQLGLIWVMIWFSMSAFLSMKLLTKPFRKLMSIEAGKEEPEEMQGHNEDQNQT